MPHLALRNSQDFDGSFVFGAKSFCCTYGAIDWRHWISQLVAEHGDKLVVSSVALFTAVAGIDDGQRRAGENGEV
jgi:hypothetical protein